MAMPPVTVEVQNEEKPLGVVTEVAYNIFFVAVAVFLAFLTKHTFNLTAISPFSNLHRRITTRVSPIRHNSVWG